MLAPPENRLRLAPRRAGCRVLPLTCTPDAGLDLIIEFIVRAPGEITRLINEVRRPRGPFGRSHQWFFDRADTLFYWPVTITRRRA